MIIPINVLTMIVVYFQRRVSVCRLRQYGITVTSMTLIVSPSKMESL